MKKIFFFSFAYPYGHFGPSDMCTTRVMEALSQTQKYDLHNISCKYDKKQTQINYKIIPNIFIHLLPFKEGLKKRSRFIIYMKTLLLLPFYPLTHICSLWKYYDACRKILREEHADLIIAQCHPMESAIIGTLLKKNGYTDSLMVIFWDNIYGKIPRRIIPKSFAIKRQRKLESWIAKYADKLISLYPIKSFHKQYGDVDFAENKRVYLGIPSIIRPLSYKQSSYRDMLLSGQINILYSGTIFRRDYVSYVVELLNRTNLGNKINLIFFCRGISEDVFVKCRETFQGTIQFSGFIPQEDLLALYPDVDLFISFPGNPNAIRSKVYEYMSYCKPIALLYDSDKDVNVDTFSRYPAFLSLDSRRPVDVNKNRMECYLKEIYNHNIPFEVVERLFPDDTASAYVKLIVDYMDKH